MKQEPIKIFTPSPSLMCGDLFNIAEILYILEKNKFKYIHIDIMDGNFVPNITLGYQLAKELNTKTILKRDIHLMMVNPEVAFKMLGLNENDLVTFHMESRINHLNTIKKLRKCKVKIGIAINPNTQIKSLIPLLSYIDHILIMTVNPGFSGQSYIKSVNRKIIVLIRLLNNNYPKITIGVDGAIGIDEITKLSKLGVTYFVLGTKALFKNEFKMHAKLISTFFDKLNKNNKL